MAMTPFPFTRSAAITASDSVNISGDGLTDAIYVGTATGAAGTLAVVDQGGVVTSLVGVLAGTIYPLRVKRVNTTGTSASNLVALYWR